MAMPAMWLALALLGLAAAPPAMAFSPPAADRTFVSGSGSDGNPCTRSEPCATFQQAYNVTAAGGEIVALDSADYGPLTVSHSITVSAVGTEGLITAANGGDAIDVAAGPTDVVVLRGLTLNGMANGGDNGISITSAGAVFVENCLIFGFGGGIVLQPSGGQPALTVMNTDVISNTFGVVVQTSSGGAATLALNSTWVEQSFGGVLLVTNGSGPISATIDGGRFDSNYSGVAVEGENAPVTVLVTSVDVSFNAAEGLAASGAWGGEIILDHSNVYDNGSGLSYSAGGIILSFGTNAVYGNGGGDVPYPIYPE